ncbi:MAG: hypothetical protein ACRC92_26085 [Peptostreptococcaceae bacterium]
MKFRSNAAIEASILLSEAVDTRIDNLRQTGENTFTWTTPLNNCAKPTQNGNLYDEELMTAAIADRFVQDRLKRNSLYGEMDHPTRDNPERFMQVYNKFRSHRFNNIYMQNGVVMGECETALSIYGRDLADYIRQGSIPAMSLRATGQIRKDKGVSRWMRLYCWDNVYTPSDLMAWGDKDSMGGKAYAECYQGRNKNKRKKRDGDLIAEKMFFEADFSSVDGLFIPVDDARTMISESIQAEFNPSKIAYRPDTGVVALITETISAEIKVKMETKSALDNFFNI